jgi:hypothetical protein
VFPSLKTVISLIGNLARAVKGVAFSASPLRGNEHKRRARKVNIQYLIFNLLNGFALSTLMGADRLQELGK